MKIVISGVQPTGAMHLGNYLGSLAKWSELQNDYLCLFQIADLHSLTVEIPEAAQLKQNIYLTLASYLACSVTPEKSIIFQQSSVPAHSELFWLLACVLQIGKLNRMTQFKDKSGVNSERSSLGLYAYPALMAADILLYHADLVPVGIDQLQHLELTNEIARSFNSKMKLEFFKKISPLLSKGKEKIMSLKDGKKKMSKSDPSDFSRINLTDTKDLIRQKILKAKTDAMDHFDQIEERLEVKNLLNIFLACSPETASDTNQIFALQARYSNLGFLKFKQDLADIVIAKISPISSEISRLMSDHSFLKDVLQIGADKANLRAEKNISLIKNLIGLS